MPQRIVFLSASIPGPDRPERYFSTADPVAIGAATRALVTVTLGRCLLVWGGHPSITPMIWAAAEDLGVDYSVWVHLYQSRLFEEDFPDENEHFRNVTYVDAVNKDREKSLDEMRRRMMTDFSYTAGVFIGGMQGVEDEFRRFRDEHGAVPALPVASTGGAALLLFQNHPGLPTELAGSLDYVGMFHRLLAVSPKEPRSTAP